MRTEHFEYSESSSCLLRHAPDLHPSVVDVLTPSPSAAAGPSGRGAAIVTVARVVGAGAVECRAAYGAGYERVQNADDDHWNDEEDDA